MKNTLQRSKDTVHRLEAKSTPCVNSVLFAKWNGMKTVGMRSN